MAQATPQKNSAQARRGGKANSPAESPSKRPGTRAENHAAAKPVQRAKTKPVTKPVTKSSTKLSTKPKAKAKTEGRRIQVRRSGVHGKGVFALQALARDEQIIEYLGEVISWDEALRRHPHDPSNPDHTFYFHIDDVNVIDAKHGGNAARWINHACQPNCEADEVDGRIFIKALRAIKPGEELFYDYGLVIDEKYTPKLKKQFACYCGSKQCRGTMLAPKR